MENKIIYVLLGGIGLLSLIALCFRRWRIYKKEDLIRKYGTAGFTYYCHLDCFEELYKKIVHNNQVAPADAMRLWKPQELIGKYSDIYCCDLCEKEFLETDEGYKSFFVTSREENEIWNRLEKKTPKEN